MTNPSLSIYDLYEYDPTIFERLVLPEGVVKDDVVGNLVIELAGLEVLYTNPHFLKNAIGLWSNARLDSWTRILAALVAEYDPLHNYDRHEQITDSTTSQSRRDAERSTSSSHNESVNGQMVRDSDTSRTGTQNTTSNGTVVRDGERSSSVTRNDTTNGQTDVTTSGTSTDSVAAYNSDILADSGKNVANGSTSTVSSNTAVGTTTGSEEEDVTDTSSETVVSTESVTEATDITDTSSTTTAGTGSGTETEGVSDSGTTSTQHTAHVYGNIGVTTSTQMLISEIDARAKYDFDSIIIREFKSRFCIMVY